MRKNANAKVFCTQCGSELLFYLTAGERSYPLFPTYHSWPIYREYENGKPIEYLFRNSRQFRQQKIRARLLQSIEYIEKEYHLQLLEKTKNQKKRGHKNRYTIEKYYHTV